MRPSASVSAKVTEGLVIFNFFFFTSIYFYELRLVIYSMHRGDVVPFVLEGGTAVKVQ